MAEEEHARIERELRALPGWLARDYLIEAGGQLHQDASITGPGWRAQLRRLPAHRVGSLEVGRLLLILEGEPTPVAELWARLEPRLLRAGG